MSQTWIIKDNAPVDEASRTLNQTHILFTSDNKRGTYIGIFNLPGGDAVLSYGDIGDIAGLDMGSGDTSFVWGKEAFKTLEFDTAPTGELLTWLQKNADKRDTEYLTRESELTSVADAIREKGGTTDPLIYPDGFVAAIESIEAGGGGSFDLSNFLQNITDVISFSFTPTRDEDGYRILKPSTNSIPRMGFVYADDISYAYNKSILCFWLYTAADPYTDVSSGANLQGHIYTANRSNIGARLNNAFLLTNGSAYGCLSSSSTLNYINIKSQTLTNNKAIFKAGIQYNGFVFFGD